MRSSSLASLAALLGALIMTAQSAELTDAPMSIEFDYSEIDMRKDEHQFRGVRISQGTMSIESDRAVAVGAAQSERATWTFESNVIVRTADASLRSSSATATIVNGTIASAVVHGSPAVFQQRNAAEGKVIEGRAGQIDYDVRSGIARFSDDVWFKYGDNEFNGQRVIYYMREERVVVNPEGANQGRVNIKVRPRQPIDVSPRIESPENSQ